MAGIHIKKERDKMSILTVNGKKWTNGKEDGVIRKHKGGFAFLDDNKEPFMFLVDNKYNEQFFVTCHKVEGKTRFLFSTTEATGKRMGLDKLGHKETDELAKSLAIQLRNNWK